MDVNDGFLQEGGVLVCRGCPSEVCVRALDCLGEGSRSSELSICSVERLAVLLTMELHSLMDSRVVGVHSMNAGLEKVYRDAA